jgi:hypothetical protein
MSILQNTGEAKGRVRNGSAFFIIKSEDSSCVNLLFPINEILNPPETVTSQHPNRGKKIPAFIIKVTKRTFDE